MKNTLILICFALAVLTDGRAFGQTPALPAQFGPHLWTATVKVVDEDGNPMVGADVSVQYSIPTTPESDQPTFREIKGLTDANGMFITSHTDSSWDLGATADKTGFYSTHIGYQFYFDEKRRHPSFTLMLKKIGNPIALYAKNVNLGMPVFDKPAGYDLMVGDWVAPYGRGINSDIIFAAHLNKNTEGDVDYKLVASFPNRGDGIQGLTRDWSLGVSGLQSLHEAPTNGYQSEWIQVRNRKAHQAEAGNFDPNRIYYFRVRTVLDSQGNVLSAHYGKTYGDFLEFSYYFNPTPNDRNVEFNPKQNLLSPKVEDIKVVAP